MRRTQLVVLSVVVAACTPAGSDTETTTTVPVETTATAAVVTTTTSEVVEMEIFTPAFAPGTPIPVKYTCDGENISPRLDVLNIPAAAVSLVLIVDDPDAPVGTWDHWVEYDIGIPGGGDVSFAEGVGVLGIQGVNSWNLPGYGGPCPPEGQNHRYFFTVYALDDVLLIPGGSDSAAVRTAMDGHVIVEASLMGTYSR